MMLLRDSPDYIQHSKCVLMMDLYPISKGSEVVPSPKAVNTHFRPDVLPEEFRNQKTVFGERSIGMQFTVLQIRKTQNK